jgi:hypothetical protein
MKRYALGLLAILTLPAFGQIPADWHQPLNEQETQWTGQVIEKLKQAPEFPRVERWNMQVNTPVNMQINAWETGKQIFVPVEMIRFLNSDQQEFAFLIAHEAGHAKQEELYGQSCYTARNVRYSKFDWIRAAADWQAGPQQRALLVQMRHSPTCRNKRARTMLTCGQLSLCGVPVLIPQPGCVCSKSFNNYTEPIGNS